jgi:lipoprotein-anchoring transpeptidase ErfK/SrfK
MIKTTTLLGISLAFATPAAAQQPWDGWNWNPFQQTEPEPEYIPPPTPQYHPFHRRPTTEHHDYMHVITPKPSEPTKELKHGDFDKAVNFHQTSATVVLNPVGEDPGTIVIDTKARRLYLVQEGGTALKFKIAVGKAGFSWKGETEIHRMTPWPAWHPPKAMIKRRPELPEEMDGGPTNPLGARAMYLFNGETDTLFRIHGTNEPSSIGKPVSSGCFRMLNADAINLYNRVNIGTKVIVR